ncbi:unnamed protein product [Pleuronectes platessa]|uniref:Uncharacterized protein n=1 Tax=Pleuronectes platessa TaxID=8262 RepID=A0A9N7V5Q4_PLEPL|nr:unnamed protein product [Pleuronectes platessa]
MAVPQSVLHGFDMSDWCVEMRRMHRERLQASLSGWSLGRESERETLSISVLSRQPPRLEGLRDDGFSSVAQQHSLFILCDRVAVAPADGSVVQNHYTGGLLSMTAVSALSL